VIANNQALDAEPPIASFLKSMLIGGGPVNAAVRRPLALILIMRTTLRQWLIDYIAYAFCRVSLGDGVDIYAAASADWYGNPSEDALSKRAERIDWRRVPPNHLHARDYALSYLDAIGYRFYMPAIMTTMLRDEDSRGNLSESFMFHLERMAGSCGYRGIHVCDLLNRSQRSAIRRFLKYQIHNCRRGIDHDRLLITLSRFDACVIVARP
jgi:hypothetical protein